MPPEAGSPAVQSNDVLVRRTEILHAINRLSSDDLPAWSRNEFLTRCGEILLLFSSFCGCWIGRYCGDTDELTPLTFLQPDIDQAGVRTLLRKQILLDHSLATPIEQAVKANEQNVRRSIQPATSIPLLPGEIRFKSYCICPLSHHGVVYGAVAIYSELEDGFPPQEMELIETTIADLSLALYAHDVSVQLQFERDFNLEIIDTIQALMITITPCGKILRFNREAEKVTGYRQEEVLDRYWVDILLAPNNRLHYQNVLSNLLKSDTRNISFRASLQTRRGDVRTIDWHSSIKPDIDKGTVGMVLFGLDITDRLAADKKYSAAVAKWENIYATIQDPALIVTRDGIIIDANHATFTASRKSSEEVIGDTVCNILHGGMKEGSNCPLEVLIKGGKSRILHTELSGLHGDYLLTISPLKNTVGAEETTLLVARDMTEEERHKAEALRAAQLASIGELAAGVAHEINNPVNGILNYAQMLKDLSLDNRGEEILGRISAEGKRIAAIVKNLLDFSRHRVEEPEPVDGTQLLDDCLELVKHQLLRDDIVLEFSFDKDLPLLFCNPSQIQQVLLNIISNSRYALNERYPKRHPGKKLLFSGSLVRHRETPYFRYSITDLGSGIEHHLLDRVFDPFFSTKPNGEGTGLGLSISYGLIRDNGGYMRIKSRYNSYTTITVDLPAVPVGGD